MSIMAKQNMLKQLKNELADYITAANLELVLEKLNDALYSYDVEEHTVDHELGNEDYLNAFLDAKAIEGRSEKTISHYKYVLCQMMREMGVTTGRITIYHLRSYLMRQKQRGIADKTLEGTRSVFCSYFGWLEKEGLIKDNPCKNLSPIRCEKKVKKPFSDVELEQIREACANTRDKALVAFLLSTGCRVSEVCGLNRNDINFVSKECIVHGKGNKQRTVFFNDVTLMFLQRYFDDRHDEYPALFTGKGSERITPGAVRAMLKRIEAKTGVENIHPHRFRRTLATSLIDRGMQIQEVATILGHDKLDTTMKYVFISKDNVHNAYRRCA